MKTKHWMRILAAPVILGGVLSLASCHRIVSSMAGLSNLSNMNLEDTHSARTLPEGEYIVATHTLSGVKEVSLSTKLDCYLYQSDEPRLEVIAPSKERLGDFIYELKGGDLLIYDKKIKEHRQDDTTTLGHHLAINLYLPSLEDITMHGACALEAKTSLNLRKLSIDCSGASSIRLDSIVCEALELDLSGAVACMVGSLKTTTLKADLSGAVSLNIAGQADRLEGDFSGAVSADLEALKSRTARVEASGACSVHIYASDSFYCDTSGVVSLTYGGNPKQIEIEKSGVSSVTKR